MFLLLLLLVFFFIPVSTKYVNVNSVNLILIFSLSPLCVSSTPMLVFGIPFTIIDVFRCFIAAFIVAVVVVVVVVVVDVVVVVVVNTCQTQYLRCFRIMRNCKIEGRTYGEQTGEVAFKNNEYDVENLNLR